VVIINKYDWWMGERRRRRTRQLDIDFRDMWPKKAKFSDVNLERFGIKEPRFEKWKKKLMDQLLPKSHTLS
jgi:hypothetical protein